MGDAKRQDIATGELVDLELIRRFIVVAEELNFTRAAAVLPRHQPLPRRRRLRPRGRRSSRRPCRTDASSRVIWPASDNGLVIDVEPARFEEMVAAALDDLPEGLGRLMQNVAVTVEHGPGPPGLLGLYEGIPLTSRTSQYAGVLPDRITIYRRAICAICRTEPEVADQVRRTVIHEVAHHFGIGDDRLRELGW
jgi:predicted Zn-dependent protease with MMP-like domain